MVAPRDPRKNDFEDIEELPRMADALKEVAISLCQIIATGLALARINPPEDADLIAFYQETEAQFELIENRFNQQ